MAKKYRYQLFINKKTAGKYKYEYKYGHTSGIKIIISQGCACIDFTMGVKKEFELLRDAKFDLLIDGLKKVYLLHMLMFNKGLKIDKMILYRDEEFYEYNKTDDRFPYVYTMVDNTDYMFDDRWRDEHIINDILSSKKTTRGKDEKYIALYAYLVSQSKRYEVDQFTQLWISFNAYYNNYAHKYKPQLSNDKDCIEFLLSSIGHGTKIKSKNERNNNKMIYARVGSELAHVEDYNQFYNQLYNKEDIEGFDDLKDLAGNELSLYGAVLCEYGYYLRCRYFHGNKTTTLFSTYNEREVHIFKTINYFLNKFLLEYIPDMFI